MWVGVDTYERDHELGVPGIEVPVLPRKEEALYIDADRYRISDIEWRIHERRPDSGERLPVLILRPVFTPEEGSE